MTVHPFEKQQAILAEAFANCAGEWSQPTPEQQSVALRMPMVPASAPQQLISTSRPVPAMALPFSPKIHLDLFDSATQIPFASLHEETALQELQLFTPERTAYQLDLRLPAPQPTAQGAAPIPTHKEVLPSPVLRFVAARADTPAVASAQWPNLPTLGDLQTISCSELFDVDLACLPLEDGEGVFFALTLIPCEELPLPKLKQHYLFLIDRSNSIQEERLTMTKHAIYSALEQLPKEDTFQIFAFDSKIDKCPPAPLTPQPSALAQAKRFLDQLELGSFFSQADLSSPLMLSIPNRVAENELYTAILFTDGDALKKRDFGLSLFHDWMARNEGRVSLYVVAKEGDAALATLDAASVLNRGKLVSYSGKWSLKRKLLKLIKGIQAPVAKEVVCSAIASVPNASVTLFSEPESAPPIYQGQPYVIFGTASSLDDFVLFVQGRFQDHWLNVKKRISFLSAKKANSSLRTEWALQQAYNRYASYLQQGNPAHLAEARVLLQPHHVPVAFE
jgi:hypothetical protein